MCYTWVSWLLAKNGRSNTTYEECMEMKLYYIDNCSFWFDFKIMLKTVGTVLRKEGQNNRRILKEL